MKIGKKLYLLPLALSLIIDFFQEGIIANGFSRQTFMIAETATYFVAIFLMIISLRTYSYSRIGKLLMYILLAAVVVSLTRNFI